MPQRAQKHSAHGRVRHGFNAHPEFAKRVDVAPGGAGWLHEIKYDGYRILATLESGRVRLASRNDLDWTDRFKSVADAIKNLSAQSVVLDGEIVVLDQKGLSNFSALQNRLSKKSKSGFVYLIFDLLYLDEVDIREAPLLARKKLLQALLRSSVKSKRKDSDESPLRFAAHQIVDGEGIYQSACQSGFEGIISKRIDSPYREGRSGDWVKTKCRHEEEFVIGGFTNPGGSREGFGALLLGYWKDGKFVYAGRVGTGFNSKTLLVIYRMLKKTELSDSPFATELSREEERGAHYVDPLYVAQIKYSEWTADERLRHAVFLGLREDKSQSEVGRAA
jgi:bifunctional non-homologous end joining protein LigD